MELGENIIKIKSFEFAKRVVLCFKNLLDRREFILSKQLLRSGTAIGALVGEAEMAKSRKDFIHKMHIALKEANEAVYWIDLLFESNQLEEKVYKSLKYDAEELLKILVKIVKSSKQ